MKYIVLYNACEYLHNYVRVYDIKHHGFLQTLIYDCKSSLIS
jgi:hypothetical protein